MMRKGEWTGIKKEVEINMLLETCCGPVGFPAVSSTLCIFAIVDEYGTYKAAGHPQKA